MKSLLRQALIGLIALVASTTVFAQEWTKAQKEVWLVSENSWAKFQSGDIDGFGANLHEKYQAWSSDDALPMNKEQVLKMFRARKEKSKVENLIFNPARITVTDNSAVIDYYFTIKQTSIIPGNNSSVTLTGKQVEFWVKEGSKWLLLGDMTAFNENAAGAR